MARNDPLRNFRFRLEIDSITQAGFSEVADRRDHDRRDRLPRGHRSDARPQAVGPHQVRQHHAEVGGDATPLELYNGTRRSSAGQIKDSARR